MSKTIGIPRALLFFRYQIFWETFLTRLGCKIVYSPPTNRQILLSGINLAIDENCLPVKILLGHIDYLKDKADYILIPRIVTLSKKEESCNKFMALYDIASNIFTDVKFIDYSISERDNETQFMAYFKLGMKISNNPIRIIKAYNLAKKRFEANNIDQIKQQKEMLSKGKNKLTILIVSHPYVIHDKFIGQPILDFFKEENINVIHSDIIDITEARKRAKTISPDLYWTESKEYIGSIDFYKKKIDGIVYLMAFPCGPDALVIELCKLKIKNIPSVILVLDELQAEIGLITRLESFIDILRIKRKRYEEKN